MKGIIGIILVLLATGCRSDVFDVSSLDKWDRILFAEAAARENFDVTTHGEPWDHKVRYSSRNREEHFEPLQGPCRIKIMREPFVCNGSRDQGFFVASWHEVGHCAGRGHSADYTNVMHPDIPCYPTH